MTKILSVSFSMDGTLLMVSFMEGTMHYDFEVYYLKRIVGVFERMGDPRQTRKIRLSSCFYSELERQTRFVLVYEDAPTMFEVWEWPHSSATSSLNRFHPILAVKMYLCNIMVLTCNEISIHCVHGHLSVIQVIPPNPRGIYGFGVMSRDYARPVIAYPGKKEGQFVVAQYKQEKDKFSKIKIKSHDYDIEAIAICSKYNLVASTCVVGRKIRIYSTESGNKIYDLLRGKSPENYINNTISFSPDGKYLVADASNGNLVHVFSFEPYHIKKQKLKYVKLRPYKTFNLPSEVFGTRFCSISAFEFLHLACTNGTLYSYFLPIALDNTDLLKVPLRFYRSCYNPVRTRNIIPSSAAVPVMGFDGNDDAVDCGLYAARARAFADGTFSLNPNLELQTDPDAGTSSSFTVPGMSSTITVPGTYSSITIIEEDSSNASNEDNTAVPSPIPITIGEGGPLDHPGVTVYIDANDDIDWQR